MRRSKAHTFLLGPPEAKPNPISRAIAKRLGLDSPTGKTAFLSSFKSSTDDLTGENTDLAGIVSVEFLNKLRNQNSSIKE